MDVLSAARAVLATGPVCNVCLGRVFADRSFGLTNHERGQALRVTVALTDDEPYEEPGECWVCEGHAQTYEQWAEQILEALEPYSFETYQVGTRVPPLLEENDRLLRSEAGLPEDCGDSFKSDFNREVGKRVGARSETEVDFERPDVLAVIDLDAEYVDLQVNSAFVYGRYRKLKRGIPQTEWPCRECNASGTVQRDGETATCPHCDGAGYLYPTSVEEEVVPPIVAAMEGTDGLFHGAGREDVDARMLGTGRPFVVEVTRPQTRRPDTDSLQTTINETADGVEVTDLAIARYDMVERVKELEASKRYRATVAFETSVAPESFHTAVQKLTEEPIDQYTPTRVDHRRSSKTRRRRVYSADGEVTDDQTATVELHCEGGLYVKELISGDDGRTEPSLADLLGVSATVTELDVLAVTGESEAFEDPEYLR